MTDHKTVREALEDGAKRHERLIRSMAVCDTFGPSYLSQLTDSVYHKALAALDRIEAVETVTVEQMTIEINSWAYTKII